MKNKNKSEMSIIEAMEWLNPETREHKMDEIEEMNAIDYVDIIIGKFNEACKIACQIMQKFI